MTALDEVGTEVRVPDRVYRFLRAVAHAINRLYWRVEVQHHGEVPAAGPAIVAPVHRSFMDFFVASEATTRKLFFMAKDDLWRSRRFGRFLESLGAFPVNRSGADRLALERAQGVLERGDVLVLFPEGTRRVGPVVEDLHEGAAFLALRTGAPIVPVGIAGTDRAMPKGAKVARPVKVRLAVGAPIAPPSRPRGTRVRRSEVHRLTEQLRQALQQLADEVGTGRVGSPTDSGGDGRR